VTLLMLDKCNTVLFCSNPWAHSPLVYLGWSPLVFIASRPPRAPNTTSVYYWTAAIFIIK